MAQAWLIRPFLNGDKTNYTDEFVSKSYIATGPNGLPNMQGLNLEKIRTFLLARMGEEKLTAGALAATANNFVNKMKKGDLALLLDGQMIYAMEITSDYEYFTSKFVTRIFLCHRRSINILNGYDRNELSDDLRQALKTGRQIADISKHYAEVYDLCYNQEAVIAAAKKEVKSVKVSYPLRADYQVEFTLPADMTAEEAERLDAFIKSLYFKE